MPLSIKDLYQSAEMGDISWEQALLLTGLMYIGEVGLMVSPPPTNESEYNFYISRLDALTKYPNKNYHYNNIVEALGKYIGDKTINGYV